MRPVGFALTLQEMSTPDAALSLSLLAGSRTENGWFRTREVAGLYESFRIPEPANISKTLGRLRDDNQFLRNRGATTLEWTVTPRGQRHVEEVIGSLDYAGIQMELDASPGAIFAHAHHSTLPPALAPPPWAKGISSFLDRYPFEKNVFLMTRFPRKDDDDHLDSVITLLREELRKYGLSLHLASDQQIVDELWANVGAHMWACRYGIGLLEVGPSGSGAKDLNDNVLIELGAMLTIGRRCMILKDRGAPSPPTDLTSLIFKEIDFLDPEQTSGAVSAWIERDLRL